MAIEKLFTLPQNQNLSSEIITNLYLYTQATTPTGNELLISNLIRPELDLENSPNNVTNIASLLPFDTTIVNTFIDAEPYMESGPGRFANGSQFDLVRAFFGLGKDDMLTERGKDNLLEGVILPPGSYLKEDIDERLFQLNSIQGGGLGSFSSSIELRNYRDNIDDYDELVYVWNSSVFSLPDNVEFVVNPNGTREIRNFKIQPNAFPDLQSKENFDFETANPLIEIGSELILEPRVDPSGIGRTVFIDFYDRQNIPLYDPQSTGGSVNVYDIFDFNQDLATEEDNYEPASIEVIDSVERESEKLFDLGVTEFLYKEKPILYGTVNNDILNANDISQVNFPFQVDKSSNGVVLLGGKGNDNLTGDAVRQAIPVPGLDDILYGHEGNDTLNGLSGNDTLYGQANNDLVIGLDGNDRLLGDLGRDTLAGGVGNDILNGGSGNDTLYGQANNDRVFGLDGNDQLRGDLGNDIITGGAGNDILIGSVGDDTLTGGIGNDRYVFKINSPFNLNSIGKDTITDFGNGIDTINLSKTTFNNLASEVGNGFSDVNEFAVVSQDSLVASSEALIVYDSGNGNLLYNENGSNPGLGSGGIFATLTGNPSISQVNFVITN